MSDAGSTHSAASAEQRLAELRRQIDAVDAQIVELLNVILGFLPAIFGDALGKVTFCIEKANSYER
jgi:hypothetical protein